MPFCQIKLIIILTIIYAEAKKPPGYVEPPKVPDPNPPKYEYGYTISDEKGDGQGKQEQRDGIYALGRYYVQGKEANQNIQYFADDWGYHPVVEYSSVGPHSRARAHFALGAEAVKQLENKENNLPQLQGILETTESLKSPTTVVQTESGSPTPIPEAPQKTIQPLQEQLQLQQSPQQQQSILLVSQNLQNDNQERGIEKSQPRDQQLVQILQEETPQEQSIAQPLIASEENQDLPQQNTVVQTESFAPSQLVILENQQQIQEQTSKTNQDQQQILIQQPENHQIFIQQVPQIQLQLNLEESQDQNKQEQKSEGDKQVLVVPQHLQLVSQQPRQDVHSKNHPQDNIILTHDQVNTQLIYHLEQSQQAQNEHIQNNIVQRNQAQHDEQNINFQIGQHETAALFEDANSKLIGNQIHQNKNSDEQYDELSVSIQNHGEFGAKLNIVQNNLQPENKLIETTKNLVTGQDVLNINEAISQSVENVESSTSQSISTSQIQSSETHSNIEINSSDGSYSTTTVAPVSEISLKEQPIVVADLEENTAKSTLNTIEVTENIREEYYSPTSTAEPIASNNIDTTHPSTVLVTPRPVSTNFLAPITAGIRLENLRQQTDEISQSDSLSENYKVDIQKSLPYYLGKYEYPAVYGEHVVINQTSNTESNAAIKAAEDIELGKTLLFFPSYDPSKYEIPQLQQTGEIQQLPSVVSKHSFTDIVSNHINVQQVPSTVIKENFAELDQQQAQGIQHQVTVQNVDYGAHSYATQAPTEVTKVVHQPYPVKVPYEVPYPVVKQVEVPVTVEKIIERPIHITKYIEKPVPVPQPYPIEKIVEKPVHVPVQVTKYIDRPYPVEVRIPYPQPYTVEKVVQKIVKQPYPVEVRIPVPVEKIIERKVPVPHYIEKPVEKIIEKPVPHYIDRPYPVEVKVPVPQPYLVRVEVPKPYLQRPYGTFQRYQTHTLAVPHIIKFPQAPPVGVPTQIYGQTRHSNNHQEQHAQQSQQQQTYIHANPYAYAPHINQYLPPKHEITVNNGYLPAKQVNIHQLLPQKQDCEHQNTAASVKNVYYSLRPDDYVGLLPPKVNNNELNLLRKYRTARSNFNEKSIRMEYGFMPPLIPSLEIDEQGNPIEKDEK